MRQILHFPFLMIRIYCLLLSIVCAFTITSLNQKQRRGRRDRRLGLGPMKLSVLARAARVKKCGVFLAKKLSSSSGKKV